MKNDNSGLVVASKYLPGRYCQEADNSALTPQADGQAILFTGESTDLASLFASISKLLCWAADNTFDSEIQFQCRIRLNDTHPLVEKLQIKRVIFNNPATVIYWADGTKTIVKCQPGDTYDREKGFMAAYMKKLLGNNNQFNKVIKKWVTE